MPPRLTALAVLLLALPAQAVIVRGKVLDPLGHPLPGARIQLILGPKSVSDTISGVDGDFEIRTDLAGRFVLLTSSSLYAKPAIQIGRQFYGGATDLITQNIVLDPPAVTPRTTSQPTLLPTARPQLTEPTTQVAAERLIPEEDLFPSLPPIVQYGQQGSPAYLYLRGADPAAIKLTLDGHSIEDLGGRFDLSTLQTSGLAGNSPNPALELTPGPNPLYLIGAEGGTLSLATPQAAAQGPVLIYQGDAGTLDAVRNEGLFTYTHTRFDALASFARFDIANSIPAAPFHNVTYAANIGYHIAGSTSARLTFRDDTTAAALPSPIDLFGGLAPVGRLAHQNLYSTFTLTTETSKGWGNLVAYAIARKREQAFNYATPLFGRAVTLTAPNGFTASGQALFDQLPTREDLVSNRDEASYQTFYPFRHYLAGVFSARYQDERAADQLPATKSTTERQHIAFSLGLQGDVKNRFFYQAAGQLDHSNLQGFHGAPSLGLSYAAVRPGPRRFRGTTLHVHVATGFREPSLLEQENVQPSALSTPRSRTLTASVDQSILTDRLSVRVEYFHSQYSHQFELLNPVALTLSGVLAYRAQGLEFETHYQPTAHLQIQGGYSYLATYVEQTAATPIVNQGIAIGASTALLHQRPFHRPPQSGHLAAEFITGSFTASFKGSFAGHSDDSTNLIQTPSLLLPNRDLAPAYASLDANATYTLSQRFTVFTELTNLTDSRHIAPFGFESTPFLIRSGLRIRLGRE